MAAISSIDYIFVSFVAVTLAVTESAVHFLDSPFYLEPSMQRSILIFSLFAASALPAIASSTPADTLEFFLAAIAKEDRAGVIQALDANVQIYESGYVERSREEYLSHHFASDAKFAKSVKTKVLKRQEVRSGDQAVIWSETSTEGIYQDKPVKHLGTETAVLKLVDGNWRIVHLHWSSRKP